jgi:hypothetical protein
MRYAFPLGRARIPDPRSGEKRRSGALHHRSGVRPTQIDVEDVVSDDPLRVIDLDPPAVSVQDLAESLFASSLGDAPLEPLVADGHHEDDLILHVVGHTATLTSAVAQRGAPNECPNVSE